MQTCQVRNLGLVPYQQAWDMQAELAAEISAGKLPATLLLLEHPHTITFGRKGKAENLLWSKAELKQRHVQVFWVDRGGDVTYHGPGQLVGYPLLPLNARGLTINESSSEGFLPHADYTGYLRKLEQVLILALHQLGVAGERIPGLTGVWVEGAKIAAIGVKVDVHGVTRHGFALNVDPDMHFWEAIIGCGLADCQSTCLAELLPSPPSMPEVCQAVISAFAQVFEYECTLVS